MGNVVYTLPNRVGAGPLCSATSGDWIACLERTQVKKPLVLDRLKAITLAVLATAIFTGLWCVYCQAVGVWLQSLSDKCVQTIGVVSVFLVGAGILWCVRELWLIRPEDREWSWLARDIRKAVLYMHVLLHNLICDFMPTPASMEEHLSLAQRSLDTLTETFLIEDPQLISNEGRRNHLAQGMIGAINAFRRRVYNRLNMPVPDNPAAEKMSKNAVSELWAIVTIVDGYWMEAVQHLPKNDALSIIHSVKKALSEPKDGETS